MAITVKIGQSTFICETAAEAVQVHRLINNTSMNTNSGSIHGTANLTLAAVGVVGAGHSSANLPLNGGDPAFEFLKRLEPFAGQRLNSTQMKTITGASSEHGVGPKLASYRRQLEQQSPSILLSDYITPHKQADGTMMWAIRPSFSSSEKSA